MLVLITVLIVLASIVLILVVLVQNSKGGGLSSNFASSNQIMGVRKTTDFIEKLTWGLAGLIIVLSLISGKLIHTENQLKGSETPNVNVQTPVQTAPNVESNMPATTPEAAPAEQPAPTAE